MSVRLVCLIGAFISVYLVQVRCFTSIPNGNHRYATMDPRVEALQHRLTTLQKTLSDMQRHKLHSHNTKSVAHQPVIRRPHPLHTPITPSNFQHTHMVHAPLPVPFTSDLLDHYDSRRSLIPEEPYPYYTAYVPDPPFYE